MSRLLEQLFSDVPVIRRPGVINAWRWPGFRQAVEKTGRKKLIIAGISASTCLQFPALDSVLEEFDVTGVIDADQ
ncbi:MAG: isochorismatase family protein [Candidatus Bathyarchaeia archaeon]|jgi:nicotinamidase-related amidase